MKRIVTRRRFIEAGLLSCLSPRLALADGEVLPVSHFGPYASADEVTQGIDLSGKTMVVTGCNSGIGYETMRVLAMRGAHVIGTARTAQKGRDACTNINGRVTPVVLELSDFSSVVACAQQIRAMNVPVDALICNAGVLLAQLQEVNGIEMQFVVNHLGHFLLTHRLLDRLVAAPQGRVVVLGSVSHWEAPQGGIQFDNLSGHGWERGSYGHSKLANGLFSLELARRLRGSRATSNCLHPGGVKTQILRHFNYPTPTGNYRFKTPAEGAATSCYLATNPALAKVSGYYFEDCNAGRQSPNQTNVAMARRLWEVSEYLTREYLM